MNYGFIGAGNMAGAIIKGMTIGGGGFDGRDIYVYDLNAEASENLAAVWAFYLLHYVTSD